MIESGFLYANHFAARFDLFALVAFVVIAALYDIKSRRIPNLLIIVGLFTSIIYQATSEYGHGLAFWALGFVVGFVCFLPLYIIRAMGAGDVKLIALVGSFVGATGAFQIVILTVLAGGALALLVMLWNRSWKLVFENIGLMTANITIAAITRQLPKAEAPAKSAGNLPYGVAIAAGTLLYICLFRP